MRKTQVIIYKKPLFKTIYSFIKQGLCVTQNHLVVRRHSLLHQGEKYGVFFISKYFMKNEEC